MVFFCFTAALKMSILFCCSSFIMKAAGVGATVEPGRSLLSDSASFQKDACWWGAPPQGWSIPLCLSSFSTVLTSFANLSILPQAISSRSSLCSLSNNVCLPCFQMELKDHFLVVSLCKIYNFLDCITSWSPAFYWTNNFPIQFCPCHCPSSVPVSKFKKVLSVLNTNRRT